MKFTVTSDQLPEEDIFTDFYCYGKWGAAELRFTSDKDEYGVNA